MSEHEDARPARQGLTATPGWLAARRLGDILRVGRREFHAEVVAGRSDPKGAEMRALAVTFLGVVALAAASVAQAAPPTITPAPASDFVDTTCGFPVSVTFVVNDQTAKTFTDGSTIVTGHLVASFSANGKSVTLNVSGPATITPTDSSVTIVGHGVGAGPQSTPGGGVTLAYAPGVVTIDPNSGVVTLVHGAFLLDICAALAV